MKFSYNWLKELVPFKETPERLSVFLTERALEVESIEKVGSDVVMDLKLFSNRVSDASGHVGLAKEIATLKNLRLKNQSITPKLKEDKKYKTSDYLTVKIENSGACPRYSARILGEITVKPSPKWIRERLETCGIQSINNVVDAANYVMLETGQPMHVFDFEKIRARSKTKKTIYVRNAKKDETMPALDGTTYSLTPETVVIADEEGAIAIAGIKGGSNSGVSENTATIILEAANFDSAAIRTTSQSLGLRTDASMRFEHGMDPNQTRPTLDRLAELIQELAGGIILHDVIDIYPHREKAKEILFRVDYANQLIGVEAEADFYHNAFHTLGCVVRTKRKDEFIVEPPTIRRDLAQEEDLIEEAARIMGYDTVPTEAPEVAALTPIPNDELFWEKKMVNFAVSSGFYETMVYEFTGGRELAQYGLDATDSIELENPTSPETRYLVPRALIKYISKTQENLRHTDAVQLFGIAKSFSKNGKPSKNTPVSERKDLIFILAKKGSSGKEEFYLLKGILDQLFESLGITDFWYDDAISRETPNTMLRVFHPYRVAEIKVGNTLLGRIGEIHPAILTMIKSKTRIVAAEIDFESLWKIARFDQEFIEVSKFPSIVRDIAITVPENIKTETILNTIEEAGEELLIDSDLFDYFQDEAMQGEEEKSLAFHLIFQSRERTLKDEEIEKIMKKITAAIEERGWEVRK